MQKTHEMVLAERTQAAAVLEEKRRLEQYANVLRESYDELFEFNLTRDTYRILYYRPHKYVIPKREGCLSSLLVEVVDWMVHPEDQRHFVTFFVLDDLRSAFASGLRSRVLEFRKRWEDGSYRWAQATVLPVAEAADEVVICYVLDIDARKRIEEKNQKLQEICNFVVQSEYELACFIDAVSKRYEIYLTAGAPQVSCETGAYESLLETLAAQVHPEDRAAYEGRMRLDRALRNLERGGGKCVFAFRGRSGETWRWRENCMICLKGEGKRILLTTRDIHARREAEAEARRVEESFLRSFGNIYSVIAELDLAARRIVVLKGERLRQKVYPLDGAVRHFCRHFVQAEDRAFVQQAFSAWKLAALVESGQRQDSVEIRCLARRGVYEWMELSLYAAEAVDGRASRFFVTLRNVDAQKMLRGIVDRFVYDNCDYFIYLDAKRDSYVTFSGSDNGTPLPPVSSDSYTREMTLYTERYVAPEDAERVVAEMQIERVLEALEQKEEYVVYCGVQEQGGYARKKLQYVYADRASAKLLLTRTDVTHIYEEERRKSELLRCALEEARLASRAKTDFLSRMSHDIRTPMNAIIGMTAIAQAKLDDRARLRDCLDKIASSSRYLLSLLNDVLDMSKIESGKLLLSKRRFSFADLLQSIEAMVRSQAQQRGVRFVLETEAAGDAYVGDAVRLKQVLMNLLSNAVKFTPQGGSVYLRAAETKRSDTAAWVRFEVQDTGVGMSASFMARMYEPFEQEAANLARNQVGSGLGLSIVRNLVRLMGGEIAVKSEAGVGTVFTVSVRLDLPLRAAELPPEKRRKQYAQLRVLVADDDAIACEHTAVLLGNLGVRSEWVDSGEAAVRRAAQASAAGAPFDLVLLDWRMPGLGGIDAARRIRAQADGVRIALMTAYDWRGEELAAQAAGVDAYLSKPLFQQALCDLLQEIRLPREAARPKDSARFAGQRVLLVEDNDFNREIAETLLELAGLRVETARDGKEALALFLASQPGRYAAVLMDIRMPVMDGLAATRAIRALTRVDAWQVPIIAMTANAFEEDREAAFAAGMSGYLIKPLEIEKLYRLLEEAIAKTTAAERSLGEGVL